MFLYAKWGSVVQRCKYINTKYNERSGHEDRIQISKMSCHARIQIKLLITYLLDYWLYVLKKVHLIINKSNIEKHLLFKKVTDVSSDIFWETKFFLNS